MTHFDAIVRNGLIVDGTGRPSFKADVGVVAGRVAVVGDLSRDSAIEEIDAAGKIVAPGHITQHAHYDAALFWSPSALDSAEQGVTSVLNANCGFGLAPVKAGDRERVMLMLSTTEQIPVEQQRIGLPWTWQTFPEFVDHLRALPKALNVMTYIPVNPLLIYVMGVDAAKTRRPTAAEMSEIHRLIDEAMDAGAVGIALSVMGAAGNSHVDFDGSPMPTDTMHVDDIVEVARALVKRGGGIVQTLAQIGPNGSRDVSAAIARMAKHSGVRVIHNIFLAIDGMPEATRADLEWLDGLRSEGLDIVGATILHSGWVEAGIKDLDTAAGQMHAVRQLIQCEDDNALRDLLANPEFVRRFVDEYALNGASNGAGGFEHQIVIDVGEAEGLRSLIGKTLAEIAAVDGKSVVETLCGLALRSNLALQIKSMPFAAVDGRIGAMLLAHPHVTAGVSDGGAHTKAFSSGAYATEMLVRMVREQGVMSLEEMHHNLSLKIARALGIANRGAIAPGYWADLIIYDLNDLYFDRSRHRIVHDMPGGDWRRLLRAGGYSRVLVNGVTTYVNGEPSGALPGVFIHAAANSHDPERMAAE